jgi:hypothetical protein
MSPVRPGHGAQRVRHRGGGTSEAAERWSGDVEDADFGVCLKEGTQFADDVSGEQLAGEVLVGMGDGGESVQDLDVFVADQKVF